MMPAIIDVSLAIYLKEKHLYAYKSSPRIDRIMIDAYRLADDYEQDVNALFIIWAMMRIQGSIMRQLLLEFGLSEEKVRAECALPGLHAIDLNRLFAAVVSQAQAQGDITLGTEHLFLALLTDGMLQCQLAVWGLNPQQLRNAALSIRETDR